MIIWINGAFGAGKTHTAFELARRLGDTHVADPEILGFGINKVLPPGDRGDFQDRPQWRTSVAQTLIQADAEDGPTFIIVPMTLVNPDYFDDIIGEIRSAEIDVRHYALQASPEVLQRRLSARTLGFADSWALEQIPRCVSALATDRFATHLDTNDRSLDEVVEAIAADLGLPLAHGRLGTVGSWRRRIEVTIRNIRL